MPSDTSAESFADSSGSSSKPWPSALWIMSSMDANNDYRSGAYNLVNSLYELSPADRARMVPFIEMYVPESGGFSPKDGAVLSTDLTAPPNFGEMIGTQFSDRPDASIENVSVKTVMPRGWKTFREIDINLIVHKPSAVFGESAGSPTSMAVQQILDYRNDIIIQYGWHGPPGINLVHGASSNTGGSSVNQMSSSRRVLRVKTTHYNFQLTPAGQVKFQIHAIENGEVAMRNYSILSNKEFSSKNPPEEGDKQDMNLMIMRFRESLFGAGAPVKGSPLKLIDIFNKLFADPLRKVAGESGYKRVRLEFDWFNAKCPKTIDAWGGVLYGKEGATSGNAAGLSIGDFLVPREKVAEILGLSSDGYPLTIDLMMQKFINLANDPTIWVDSKELKYQVPELMLRTILDPSGEEDQGLMYLQVIDRKRYISFKATQLPHEAKLPLLKQQIKENVDAFTKDNNMPIIKLYHQGSFIKNSNFSVVNDEQMKSIFVRRQMERESGKLSLMDGRITPQQTTAIAMLYRSAIKGDITMIGNHFFEMFGTVYVDFGIWAYDGIFYIMQKVDKISRDGFETVIGLQAEGSDPLGYGTPAQSTDIEDNKEKTSS